MSRKQVSYVEREFTFRWADRWRELTDLIFDLIHTDNTWAPSVPSELKEIRYQDIRCWLIENEKIFLELWKGFCTSWDWFLDTSNDLIEEIRDAEKALEKVSAK